MALIQMTVFSRSLMRTVPVNVILPADKMPAPGEAERGDRPYPTLYLLHGIFGSYVDWVSGTRIQRFAEDNDLAVVMPSGDNAFYVDQPKGHNYYGEFVGRELVELTRKMFPLSRERAETFIGGLSMGGFGALRNGLKYCDTFGAITALSSALVLDESVRRKDEMPAFSPMFLKGRSFAEACFGDLDKVLGSDKDPEFLIKRNIKEGRKMPAIYMACGEDDGLLECNQEMASFLEKCGVPVTFEVGPGAHEWDFWDRYIEKAIKWLPINKGTAGINSGNVI